MNKMHEVAKYEYTRHVNNKAFWITLFAVPAGILLIMLLSVVITFASIDTDPVGYVDQAGLIKQPQEKPSKTSLFEPFIPLIPYADETSARGQLRTAKFKAILSSRRAIRIVIS